MLAFIILVATTAFAQDDEASFTSTQSGKFHEAIWQIEAGEDVDGIPDFNDSVKINNGHVVSYAGQAESALVHEIIVEQGASLLINNPERQKLWISGQLAIHGALEIRGAHELIFDSNYENVSGIRIYPEASFTMTGVRVEEGVIRNVERPDNELVVVEVENANYLNNELAGKKLKLMDGLNANFVYDIVENTNSSITIKVDSRGWHKNAGVNEPISPIEIDRNEIQLPPDFINEMIYAHRSKSDQSGQYVGKFVEFIDSGNQYLIVGALNGKSGDIITLLSDVADADLRSPFIIHSGINRGDSFIIVDYATASIPESHQDDGVRHAMFHADAAHVEIRFAEFAYFGTHLEEGDPKYDLWPETLSGLNFFNIGSDLVFEHVDIHHHAARTAILFSRCTNISVENSYLWDVHPKTNPKSDLEAGHGWAFHHAAGMTFSQNVAINQGDDHLFIGRESVDAIVQWNKLINTPWPRGNSANNLEFTPSLDESSITITGNLLLNSDGNVNVQFREHGDVVVEGNVIATTLSRGGGNLVIRKGEGIVQNNIFSGAQSGLAIFGESNIEVRNNVFKDHVLGVRNPTQLVENLFINSSAHISSEYGSFTDDIVIDSNYFDGAELNTGQTLRIADPKGTITVPVHISQNTIDGKLYRSSTSRIFPFLPSRFQSLANLLYWLCKKSSVNSEL